MQGVHVRLQPSQGDVQQAVRTSPITVCVFLGLLCAPRLVGTASTYWAERLTQDGIPTFGSVRAAPCAAGEKALAGSIRNARCVLADVGGGFPPLRLLHRDDVAGGNLSLEGYLLARWLAQDRLCVIKKRQLSSSHCERGVKVPHRIIEFAAGAPASAIVAAKLGHIVTVASSTGIYQAGYSASMNSAAIEVTKLNVTQSDSTPTDVPDETHVKLDLVLCSNCLSGDMDLQRVHTMAAAMRRAAALAVVTSHVDAHGKPWQLLQKAYGREISSLEPHEVQAAGLLPGSFGCRIALLQRHAEPVAETVEADPGLCWGGPFNYDTCCSASFGSHGNSMCWTDGFNYERCCGNDGASNVESEDENDALEEFRREVAFFSTYRRARSVKRGSEFENSLQRWSAMPFRLCLVRHLDADEEAEADDGIRVWPLSADSRCMPASVLAALLFAERHLLHAIIAPNIIGEESAARPYIIAALSWWKGGPENAVLDHSDKDLADVDLKDSETDSWLFAMRRQHSRIRRLQELLSKQRAGKLMMLGAQKAALLSAARALGHLPIAVTGTRRLPLWDRAAIFRPPNTVRLSFEEQRQVFLETLTAVSMAGTEFWPISGTLIGLLRYGSMQGKLCCGKVDIVDRDTDWMVRADSEKEWFRLCTAIAEQLLAVGWHSCELLSQGKVSGLQWEGQLMTMKCFRFRYFFAVADFQRYGVFQGVIYRQRVCGSISDISVQRRLRGFHSSILVPDGVNCWYVRDKGLRFAGRLPLDYIMPLRACRAYGHSVPCPNRAADVAQAEYLDDCPARPRFVHTRNDGDPRNKHFWDVGFTQEDESLLRTGAQRLHADGFASFHEMWEKEPACAGRALDKIDRAGA